MKIKKSGIYKNIDPSEYGIYQAMGFVKVFDDDVKQVVEQEQQEVIVNEPVVEEEPITEEEPIIVDEPIQEIIEPESEPVVKEESTEEIMPKSKKRKKAKD